MTTATKTITPCPVPFSDHVYKTIEQVSIPLRIWPATDDNSGPKPWLLWIHGGGFTAGKHVIPNAWVIPAFRLYGYHVVSVAYRFLPHVCLADMMDDIADSLAWCRSNLPTILGVDQIDIDAYAVGGDSAGGTLSTLCGYKLSPKPRAVIDLYGVVDFTDRHYHQVIPKEEMSEALQAYLAPNPKWTEEEVITALADRDPSHAKYIGAWTWELAMPTEDVQSFWGMPEYQPTDEHVFRMEMMKYMSAKKKMVRILLRGESMSDEEFDKTLRQWSSYHMLDNVQDKTGYPPIFFLHGTADSAVPVDQSYRFANKLKSRGFVCGEVYAPDAEHCFENKIECPDDEGWQEYVVPVMNFCEKHVRSK